MSSHKERPDRGVFSGPVPEGKTMEKKTFRICAGIMAVVIGALIWLNCTVQPGTKPDREIPMANARIEWTGAGYSGIYGR